ncbi:hypothetical protein SPHINGOAX6_50087 [Sphingomonas sp. AX6]|nr:hypothetical protein SPHINGOAX6_50087 [Sphingomonas sp. AX6]
MADSISSAASPIVASVSAAIALAASADSCCALSEQAARPSAAAAVVARMKAFFITKSFYQNPWRARFGLPLTDARLADARRSFRPVQEHGKTVTAAFGSIAATSMRIRARR